MRRLDSLRLAVVAAAALTASARAGDDMPVSRSAAASPHKILGHAKPKGHTCAKCAAAAQAGGAPQAHQAMTSTGGVPPIPGGMSADSQIVGCSHSANGVCAPCRKLLEMPGEVTMVREGVATAPTSSDMAIVRPSPGRAVASDSAPGRAVIASGEPEPIGVMKTNYSPNGAPMMGAMPAGVPAGMKAPGAGNPMPTGATRAPFLPETREGNPRILGHLFGFSAMGRDMRDARESRVRRKRETHAATAYGPDNGRVEELPASMVYGKMPN